MWIERLEALQTVTDFCGRVCFARGFARDEVVVFAWIIAMLSVAPPPPPPPPPPTLSRACSNLPQQVPSSDHISFLGSRARYGSIELDMSTELDRPSISEQPRGTILPFNRLIFSYRICRGKKYLYRHSRYTQVFGHTMYSFSSSFCSFLVPAFINAYFNVFVGLLLFTQKATSVSIIRRGIVVQIT